MSKLVDYENFLRLGWILDDIKALDLVWRDGRQMDKLLGFRMGDEKFWSLYDIKFKSLF